MTSSPGAQRTDKDGSRRFTPVNYSFDTRAHILDTVVEDDWEPAIREQWLGNIASVREHLIHQFGAEDHEQKIQNFTDLGTEPWSLVALHNVYLRQIRYAFVGMNYYPALLGACGLGERILNQLVLTLRADYANHEATKHVATQQSIDKWDKCIRALTEWGLFTADVASDYRKLMKLRHGAVHYRSELDSGDAREPALAAVLLLGKIIQEVFTPIGNRPFYFAGPIGRAYVQLEAESEPFVKHFVLPACALVSPIYRFHANSATPGGFDVYDDEDYGATDPALSDAEFADPSRASPQVPMPF
ncbi:hypothetical protein D0Z08_31230 [Nocardioides immobilis]|uniref:Uncharacterized protein n=1 Tax=Nocardioides immobilis TaxID=2049295 RepID=A0A417XSC3_9ACTN|nr:hypothetical protein D0Z08_31230 [Nocardioides immobilis]